jgi:Uma2 family endonuclease
MTIPEDKKLSVNEFFEAVSDSEERYELVEGVVRLMARANERHNVIRSNVLAAFVPAGKQRGCRATSVNTGVQTGPDTIRYPDVVVDCGPRNAQALTASKPTIVVEVFAPGTAVFDHSAKLREYRTWKASAWSFRSTQKWYSSKCTEGSRMGLGPRRRWKRLMSVSIFRR